MTDPLWDEYVDAVRGLGRLPERRDELHRRATAAEEAALRQAQATVEAETARSEEWAVLAKRSVGTAETRLVQAQVLVPDPAAAPSPPEGSPAELVGVVRQTEHELATDIQDLGTARRRASEQAIERARRAAALAARVRAIVIFAAVGAVVVVVIVVLAVLAG